MALMNKPRAHKSLPGQRGRGQTAIASLVIVPHRDLAHQMYHWVERIVSKTFSSPKSALHFLANVLVRDAAVNMSHQLKAIQTTPPHILIATPQALLDGVIHNPEALQLPWLQAVAVDEADYLIPLASGADEPARGRAQKKLDRHLSPTIDILSRIYGDYNAEEEEARSRGYVSKKRPQLILSSATLHKGIREHLAYERGWIRDTKDAVRINGDILRQGIEPDPENIHVTVSSMGNVNVVHHALYVDPAGRITNIEEAVDASLSPPLSPSTSTQRRGDLQTIPVESQRNSPTVNRTRAEGELGGVRNLHGRYT